MLAFKTCRSECWLVRKVVGWESWHLGFSCCWANLVIARRTGRGWAYSLLRSGGNQLILSSVQAIAEPDLLISYSVATVPIPEQCTAKTGGLAGHLLWCSTRLPSLRAAGQGALISQGQPWEEWLVGHGTGLLQAGVGA